MPTPPVTDHHPYTTIQQALSDARQQLSPTLEAASLEAEILLGHVLQQSRAQLYTWPHKPISDSQLSSYKALLARRFAGEPIAYIVGFREFWDLPLRVSPATLIPRPETERLVEISLELIPTDKTWHVADLGTGTGAIAIAIAKHRPRSQVVATDISIEALTIAQQNATQLKIPNLQFKNGAWCQPLKGMFFDLIVSNPPYITKNDPHLKQGDLRYEPALALTSGQNGLQDITNIVQSAPTILKNGGWLLLEHGFNQGDSVTNLLSMNNYKNISKYHDYEYRERASLGQKSR
ncbi:MAG: peptide chain release factor N(5)-glutamine methyltransferase [Gammaproteobacteria bacterium]|nr:peptide chain release factor N(5)-glutamine methyltransferase [Gammaproteobacteria bacterium]